MEYCVLLVPLRKWLNEEENKMSACMRVRATREGVMKVVKEIGVGFRFLCSLLRNVIRLYNEYDVTFKFCLTILSRGFVKNILFLTIFLTKISNISHS